MPSLKTAVGTAHYAVLIPSRGRPDVLAKAFQKMPWLDTPDTIIGVQYDEWPEYAPLMERLQVRTKTYANPKGSVAVAREELRKAAMMTPFTHYVVTDDNALHPSRQSLENLVRATAEWPDGVCTMAGMHNTAAHFDRGKLHLAREIYGLRSYPAVAMIFQCYPHVLYEAYRYPPDAFGLDDRHFYLWCIDRGITSFRVCMDAPFTKSRYQKGGQGSIEERMVKNGLAIARLAIDFPRMVGATGTLRIPWQFILKMKRGTTADRLPGGAMRKESALIKPTTVRVRKTTH